MFRRIQRTLVEREVRRRGGTPERGQVGYEKINADLERVGIEVEPYTVPVDDLDAWVADAGYADLPYYDGGRAAGAREKQLEHFVSVDLLEPGPGDVLVDVACMDSPFSEITAELHDLRTYRQDLMYPEGLRGRTIGGDAADLPVPDEFADHLTLHCSFEHFEGDSDSRFIREAARVLKPGGKLCILPLYTTSSYAIQTHTRGWRPFRAPIERGDTVYVGERWGPPHARFYDAPTLLRRVLRHLGELRLRIFEVTNLAECGSACYLQYAALIEKPA